MAEKDPTRKTAVEIPLSMEVADKQASYFRNLPKDGGIHHVKPLHPLKKPKNKKPSFHCGEDHILQKCQFKDDSCHANQRGTSPQFAKRKYLLRQMATPTDHIMSRTGKDSQNGMWIHATIKTIMKTASNYFNYR